MPSFFQGLSSVQVAPGICDGISARCALDAGFSCLYQRSVALIVQCFCAGWLKMATGGAATTASRLGQPDLAIATLNDFVQVIENVRYPCLQSLLSHAFLYRQRKWSAVLTLPRPSSQMPIPGLHTFSLLPESASEAISQIWADLLWSREL